MTQVVPVPIACARGNDGVPLMTGVCMAAADQVGQADSLRAHGADVVVSDPSAVIGHAAFEVDPWAIRETSLDLDVLAQTAVPPAGQRPAQPAGREPARRAKIPAPV